MNQTLYSIGHGTRPIEDFLSLLLKYEIEYLIDVRTFPYSRFNPQYNQKALKSFLEEHSIRYVFMGDTLGGRPKDPVCYTEDGKIDYDILKSRVYFIEGMKRLQDAAAKGVPAAVMCSERKPQDCHRSKLIGKELSASDIHLRHIDELGNIREQRLLEIQYPKAFQ